MTALLIRDLAQIVSPEGSDAPLRGPRLRELSVTADGYVLCDDGQISEVGRMAEVPKLDDDVEELDGRGLCAIPGLVDCHTHACFAGDRVDEFDLRSGGATYEELHAAGGGILSTVRATRAAGRDGLARHWSATAAGCSRHGTTTFEAKSGYGLDRETELAMLSAIRDAGGVPTWLGAHAVPPEFTDADAYVTSPSRSCCRKQRQSRTRPTSSSSGARSTSHQARRYLEACRDAGLELRLHADQFTEAGGIPLAVELGARSVDHLEATGPEGVRDARSE